MVKVALFWADGLKHSDLFKLKSVEASGKLRQPSLRLVVDEDVIDLLDKHPELAAINAHVRQKGLGE